MVTFAISVFAIVQRNHVTIGLIILNWTLIADSIAVIVIGSFIWFYSLQQRNNYLKVFTSSTPAIRSEIQDKARRYALLLALMLIRSLALCSPHTRRRRRFIRSPCRHALRRSS